MAREIEEGQETHVEAADAAARAVERWRERAAQAGAMLEAHGEPVAALANPDDLDQVLDVIVDNAISYAPGPIELRTGRVGSSAVISLQDHGGGIPPDELPRVTERFYRGRGSPAGGSGLGLAIARELAEKWGGTIDITSAEDGGTMVEVRLRPVGGFASA